MKYRSGSYFDTGARGFRRVVAWRFLISYEFCTGQICRIGIVVGASLHGLGQLDTAVALTFSMMLIFCNRYQEDTRDVS